MEPTSQYQQGPNGWRFFWKTVLFVFIVLAFEVGYQYYRLTENDISTSLIRGAALGGATLISLALLTSVAMKWVPRYAQYWRLRRYLGVWGVVFVLLHIFLVLRDRYLWNFRDLFFSFNPFENPALFGVFAIAIFVAMALTSTDWAMQTLTPRRWKTLHRLVYFAYAAVVFHFLLLTPDLKTIPGGILVALIAATLFGQLYWFFKVAGKKNFRSFGTFVGAIIILLYLTLAYFAFSR